MLTRIPSSTRTKRLPGVFFSVLVDWYFTMNKRRDHYAVRRYKFKKEVNLAKQNFPTDAMEEYWKRHSMTISKAVYETFLDTLAKERVFIHRSNSYGADIKQEVHNGNIEKFCKILPEKINSSFIFELSPQIPHSIYGAMLEADDAVILDFMTSNKEKVISKLIMNYLRETKKIKIITEYIKNSLNEQIIYDQLLINPHYSRSAGRLKGSMMAKKLLAENIESSTPDDYTMLFPLARQINRRFIIHIGPTNSGKTYQALEDLKLAYSGIYLAPLRLLAYEQYEKMNREGVPCSMITGEEQIIMPGSFHQSSTIEMLDLNEEWDVAVIDEAQMAADLQRGGFWTNAILGIRAKVIHICASPDAETALKRMISSCSDSYEVVYHDRKTPLVMDEEAAQFTFPNDVRPGDALIVFSRKDVHAVAAELQQKGISCSIIYGSLPYDVRHREAQKYADGETEVVVATDAIGMGMNLPIKRIVFLQTVKFDGNSERTLTSSEVKQIAGRAGRYGLYDTGYVTSYYDFEIIRSLLESPLVPINKVMINIPEDFLEKEGTVSAILETWNKIPAASYYDKGDISEKISVAKELEDIENNKELIRKFLRIPANPDNKETFRIYAEYYMMAVRGIEPDIYLTMREFDAERVDDKEPNALQRLETDSAVYDFLYAYTRMFGNADDLSYILEGKRRISDKMFVILDRQELSRRKCKYCGRELGWTYKYSLCQECLRRNRIRRRR